jgi:hypothetical protein
MKLLAIAATILGLASAACPNQCSGHGRCGAFDKCICNHQDGTSNPYRLAFTGVDCSLRTCPTGRVYDQIATASSALGSISFASNSALNKAPSPKLRAFYNPTSRNAAFTDMRRDQKFLVKVMSTDFTSNKATFTWKLDEDEYYQPETTFSLNGAKKDFLEPEYARHLSKAGGIETGVFVYFDQFLGGASGWGTNAANQAIAAGDIYTFTLTWNDKIDFDAADSNSAHQYAECSGRGTCDYAAGKCKCFDGYTGEACQRTACLNMCSGHGQCQSEERFVKDAKSTYMYAAYDAAQQYGCRCDDGYRGADCSQIECPSGADILGGNGGAEGMDCSARGICDYSTGTCKCHKGYYGERCESQSTWA